MIDFPDRQEYPKVLVLCEDKSYQYEIETTPNSGIDDFRVFFSYYQLMTFIHLNFQIS